MPSTIHHSSSFAYYTRQGATMPTFNIQFLNASRSIIMRAARRMIKRTVRSLVKRAARSIIMRDTRTTLIRTTNCRVFLFTTINDRALPFTTVNCKVLPSTLLHLGSLLKVRLPTHNLGGINCVHLGRPALRRHNLAHSSHFIGRVTGNTDVVVALENDLDITNVKLRRVA